MRPEDVNVDPYAAREYDEDAPFVPVSPLQSFSDLCWLCLRPMSPWKA